MKSFLKNSFTLLIFSLLFVYGISDQSYSGIEKDTGLCQPGWRDDRQTRTRGESKHPSRKISQEIKFAVRTISIASAGRHE